MAIINRVADLHDEITTWRRAYHQKPELLYDVEETAGDVARKLQAFGCDEVVTGIGRTGVVGVIKGSRGDGPTIGLRADMDALPIEETTGLPYASKVKGKMHACGHDGHMAMLLGAAKYMAETRNFAGTAVVIFQPAEEGGAGGEAMVRDGLMERFDIQEVYGLHNMPGMEIGKFAIRSGAIMASTDEFTIQIKGKGGHAAKPQTTIDPIVVGAQLVNALQTIVSRNTNPTEGLVVSVTQFHAGNTYNVIPEIASINGTIRALDGKVRADAERRLRELIDGVVAMHGATADLTFRTGYPVTVNHEAQTQKALMAAAAVVGEDNVDGATSPMLGGEDFAYMLEAKPGAYIFMGNGDTANLHHPAYDFNDEAIPHGVSYWVKLTEMLLSPN